MSETRPTFDLSRLGAIVADDVRDLPRGARVVVAPDARLTDMAAELLADSGVEMVRRAAAVAASDAVALGADHGGYPLKEAIKAYLVDQGRQVIDCGTHSIDAVDYPDFAHAVAAAVAGGDAAAGVVVDGAGIGSAIAANKVPGVRAGACYSVQLARNAREHNGCNVLALGSGVTPTDEALEIVRVWLASSLAEDRHRRRVAKIDRIERTYAK